MIMNDKRRLQGRTLAVVALLSLPAALGGQESTSTVAIPSVGGSVQSIQFFDAVPPIPVRAERQFESRFDANRSRFIYTEVLIRHEPTGREGVEYELVCTYFRPDGTSIGESTLRFRPQPDWTGASAVNALGSARTGVWTPGLHRVACAHEGNPVVEAGFEMFSGPAAVPLVDGHFSSLRYFEWGEEAPAIADRVYAVGFEAASARRISLEIGLRFDAPGRLVMIPVTCRVAGEDGTIVREDTLNLRIEPAWTSIVATLTMGQVEPGTWQPGMYAGTCHHGSNLLGDGRFNVR